MLPDWGANESSSCERRAIHGALLVRGCPSVWVLLHTVAPKHRADAFDSDRLAVAWWTFVGCTICISRCASTTCARSPETSISTEHRSPTREAQHARAVGLASCVRGPLPASHPATLALNSQRHRDLHNQGPALRRDTAVVGGGSAARRLRVGRFTCRQGFDAMRPDSTAHAKAADKHAI